MAEKSRNKSYVQENADKGAFLTVWGKQWGLSIYPAYGIDKIKFSFIQIGNDGKGKSFDVYMDTIKDGAQCFDNWAFDILHGTLPRVLAQEKQAGEKYPKAYLYATGENVDKSIGIGNSTAEGKYIVNGSVVRNGKKEFANVQLGYHDLRHLAENFMMTYGTRRQMLAEESVKNALKYFKDKQETPDASPDKVSVPEPAPAPAPAPAEKKSAEAAEETTVIKLKTCTPMTAMSNGKDLALQAYTQQNEKKNVLFLQDAVKGVSPDIWSGFLNKTKVEGFVYTAEYTYSPKGNLIFKRFA